MSVEARGRREPGALVALVAGLSVAVILLASQWVVARFAASPSWLDAGESRLRALLDDIEAAAALTIPRLDEAATPRARIEAFHELRELYGRHPAAGLSFLLYDPDGEAVAWSGPGLLHEIDPPRASGHAAVGTGHLSSYTATTFYTRRLLTDGPRPWSVVVGRSFRHDRLPFSPGPGLAREDYRWHPADTAERQATENAAGEAVRLASGHGFDIVVRRPLVPGSRFLPLGWRWAGMALAVSLLAPALSSLRSWRGKPGEADLSPWTVLAGGAGLVSCAWSLGASGEELIALATASTVLIGALWLTSASIGRALPWVAGGLALVAWASSLAFQLVARPEPLGEQLWRGGDGLALRLAVLALVVAGLRPDVKGGRDGPSVLLPLGFGAALLAGALPDAPVLALGLLVVAGITGRYGLSAMRAGSGMHVTGVILAALLAAVAWETSHRQALRHSLEGRLAAATDGEPAGPKLRRQMEEYLGSAEAARLLAIPASTGERQDLAVALWRSSPLARRDVLSALHVSTGARETSSFSYGLALFEGRVDLSSTPPVGVVDEQVTVGRTRLDLQLGGAAESATVRFWILPLAGPVGQETAVADLELDLLRGGPPVETPRTGFPGDALLSIHTDEGAPVLSARAVPLPRPAEPRGVVRGATGRLWFRSLQGEHGIYTFYLPVARPLAALERAGVHAAGSLCVVAGLALFGLLLRLPRRSFLLRARSVFTSYSRKLIVVFTVLLVVPLMLLYLVLFRTLGERLQVEHREAGEVALTVAQRVLSDYLLALEPGFGVRAVLEQEVLDWLADVVDREVNVYWGPLYFAASRPELFTAGLMPRRIPGEVFSELALQEAPLSARTRRAGQAAYLELYAALELPQLPLASEKRFYVSTPLLEQEEEVRAQLAKMSRQAFLATLTLFLLLLAVGARLAAGFTRPVMEIVEGTGRIASGETSLGLQPSEPELRTLVAAIDEMAERIAKGREDLVREKQVFEQVVQNITAAVVSLDHRRRVLMHNRIAAELLGVEVGASIDEVAHKGELAELGAFLRAAREATTPTSRRLPLATVDDEQWSVVWVPVPGAGDPAALLVLEDVTEILRGQRLEAWAEMARIIAHEVKNPLTPIRLSTEHMRQVYDAAPGRFDEVFERCTRNILSQVDELYEITAEFSTYSRVPHMDLQSGDLVALVAAVTEAYRSAPPPGVEILFSSNVDSAPARFDERLLGRAIRNLVENAVRASREGGEIRVSLHGGVGGEEAAGPDSGGWIRVEVADRGPGVPAENMKRIFDPYFSTHDTGTGLGLPIARRIVEAHGGSIRARNRSGGGLRVEVLLPTAERPIGATNRAGLGAVGRSRSGSRSGSG